MPRRRQRQLELPVPPTWGGRRPGAGRKPSTTRSGRAHARRPEHNPRHPVHVTLRGLPALASFRAEKVFPHLRDALAAASGSYFRVLHFSVQSDHLHLIVEADSGPELAHGFQRLAVRCARAVNRALGRHGTVWAQRHHRRPLRTPREVRVALVYVLLNFRNICAPRPASTPAARERGSTAGRKRSRPRIRCLALSAARERGSPRWDGAVAAVPSATTKHPPR
jgi:REP element-mobilizing transposase RayT